MKKKAGRPRKYNYPKVIIGKQRREYFRDSLKHHGGVEIENVGVFTVRHIKPRKLYHNFSDKVISIPKKVRIHFKPDLSVKEHLCRK